MSRQWIRAISSVDPMRALLLGDSHLASLGQQRLGLLESEPEATIDSLAFGGAWSGDLRKQIGHRDLGGFDVVLMSIGTNDTHPACNSSPDTLRGNLTDVLSGNPRAVLLLSPGVQHAPRPFDTGELNAAIRAYTEVAATAVNEHGGDLIPTSWIFDRLGPAAWSADGLHLSPSAYDLLLPSLVDSLRAHDR